VAESSRGARLVVRLPTETAGSRPGQGAAQPGEDGLGS
jgi:hypothetical protein